MTSSLLTGAVIADHIAKAFGDGTLPEFLTKYDVNEDGSIDEEERQAIKEERKAARVGRRARFDIDGNGKLSLDERESLRETSASERAKRLELIRESLRKRITAKRVEKLASRLERQGSTPRPPWRTIGGRAPTTSRPFKTQTSPGESLRKNCFGNGKSRRAGGSRARRRCF